MPDLPPQDWFQPRLAALVAEAAQAGYAKDVAIAFITDLITGPHFNTAPPMPIDENWNQDIGEPAAAASGRIDQTLTPATGTEGGLVPLPTLVHENPVDFDPNQNPRRI